MTFRQARGFFEYWKFNPPQNESICVFVRAHTNWRPQGPPTEEEVIAEHRRSLEERWKAGALNPKQMYEAMGGKIGGGSDHPYSGLQMTGIGDWPPKP